MIRALSSISSRWSCGIHLCVSPCMASASVAGDLGTDAGVTGAWVTSTTFRGLLHVQGVGVHRHSLRGWGGRWLESLMPSSYGPGVSVVRKLESYTSCLTSAARLPGDMGWARSQTRITGITFTVSGSAFSTCPAHPPSDAQIRGTLQRPDVLSRGIFVELWMFYDYILKGKETDHLIPLWCWTSLRCHFHIIILGKKKHNWKKTL